MNDDYSYEDRYKEGRTEGYAEGIVDGTANGYAEGKSEAEQLLQDEITTIQYHYQQQISDYRCTIKSLKEEIYNLRKEYETITRSIQKST